jgi:tetratricopeptide (TPR) repeat protein
MSPRSRFAIALLWIVILASGLCSCHKAPPPPPAPPPLSANDLETRGLALQEKGDFPAAEKDLRECLDERERTLGPEDIDTLAALNNLANLLLDRGQLDEAEALDSRCLEARQRTLGPDHPHTHASQNNLAIVLRSKVTTPAPRRFIGGRWTQCAAPSVRRISIPSPA